MSSLKSRPPTKKTEDLDAFLSGAEKKQPLRKQYKNVNHLILGKMPA